MASSTDELSRELSSMSTSSDVNENSMPDDDSSSEKNDEINDEEDETSEQRQLSRNSTSLSQTTEAVTSREPTDMSLSPTKGSGVSTREATGVSIDGRNSPMQHSEQEDVEEESQLKENKNLSDAPLSMSSSKQSTRENTMNTNESQNENNVSSNGNESRSDSYYEDDFDESDVESGATTREQSFVDKDDNPVSPLEKEDSVLIEKDGKFELVDEKDLTKVQRTALGIKPKKKTDKQNLLKVQNGRVRKTSNPEFNHVQSTYAMSEQQKEMKTRRVSVMQMRKQEERDRQRQEQEERQKAAEKSFNKWLADKSQDPKEEGKPKKKKQMSNVQESGEDEERKKAADKAFRQWIDEKEERAKQEKKMEKMRLNEEAQSYVVRDRKTCDKAFREWIRNKKAEREKQEASSRTRWKKSQVVSKKKSLAVYDVTEGRKKESRPRLSITRDEEKADVSENKRMPKTSAVRITDTFGYRHPASIDDFIRRK